MLPFRARLRLAAFPGPTGEALARLDLSRAKLVATDTAVERFGFAYFAFLAAAEAQPLPAVGSWDQGRELYRIGVHWSHEHALRYEHDEAGVARALANTVSPHAFHVFRGLGRWHEDGDFNVTAKDRTRIGSRYVFEPAPR